MLKKLLLLVPLASCITINQGGASPSAAAPRALMMAEGKASPAMMSYSAGAVLAAYDLNKARRQSIDAALAMEGEVLQDGSELVVVRIPSDLLTNYIEGLKKFGKLESFRIEGENISRPVQDNALRIETLEKTRAKYQELLSKAVKMQDILSISREIEQIDSQLQYLQQQKKDNELRTATSDVSVQLKKRSGYGPLGWVFYILWRGVKWLFWWG